MYLNKPPKRAYATRHHIQEPRRTAINPVHFSIFVAAFVLLLVTGAVFLKLTSTSAYNITTRHDLRLFADFQKFHYNINGSCIGNQGECLRNDGIESTLPLSDYTLSKGVSITVIAGDPQAPSSQENPYTLQAKHTQSKTVYEYNFATDRIIER